MESVSSRLICVTIDIPMLPTSTHTRSQQSLTPRAVSSYSVYAASTHTLTAGSWHHGRSVPTPPRQHLLTRSQQALTLRTGGAGDIWEGVYTLAVVAIVIAGTVYAAIGIVTARQWPDPHCCCYSGHLRGRDYCTDLLTSINILLLLNLMPTVAALFGGLRTTPLTLASVILLAYASFDLRRRFRAYGMPLARNAVRLPCPSCVQSDHVANTRLKDLQRGPMCAVPAASQVRVRSK